MGDGAADSRFEAFSELVRNDPDLHRDESYRGRDKSTHLEAVEVLSREVTDNLMGRGQLFSTGLGIPGACSKDIPVKPGDLIARIYGV